MKKDKIFKATFIIMIVTLLSKVLGMVRDLLVGNIFGVSAYTDAYKAAVTIPDTIFTIIGLGISTVFIPMLSKVRYEKNKSEMFSFANNIISLLSLAAIVLLALGLIYTENVVKVFVVGFDRERLELAVFLTRISLINLLFLSINACFAAMLQVCEDFIIPSILGIFFNAPIIIYLLLFNSVNIYGLTIANVLGNLFRVIVQLPSLYKHGYKLRFHINLKDERIKKIFVLLIPVMIGSGANSLNMVVDTNVASTLSKGSMSIVDYAQKIITFANTAFTTSIVSVMYPLMANKLSEGDKKGFINYLNKSLVSIGLLLVPVSAGFIILSREIIEVFYGWGNSFTAKDIYLTSIALLGYALSIPFIGIRDILNSSLFSMQKTKVTAFNGIIGVVVNVTLSISLARKFGVFGIAVASSTAAMTIAILLLIAIRKEIGSFEIKPFVVKFIKIAAAAFIMCGFLFIFNRVFVLNGSIDKKIIITKIILNGTLGAIVYFISCKLFKIEELDQFIALLKNRKGNEN